MHIFSRKRESLHMCTSTHTNVSVYVFWKGYTNTIHRLLGHKKYYIDWCARTELVRVCHIKRVVVTILATTTCLMIA